jgi:hypothetical protein
MEKGGEGTRSTQVIISALNKEQGIELAIAKHSPDGGTSLVFVPENSTSSQLACHFSSTESSFIGVEEKW